MSAKIKFGTDGWRAIIAQEYTVENVIRVSEATATWIKKRQGNARVCVGHDCRFGGELFAEAVVKVLCSYGIKTYLAKGFVSTPMISLGTKNLSCDLGIIITASHNPPAYNGFKLKGSYGGPLIPSEVSEIENLIEDQSTINIEEYSLQEFLSNNLLEYVDLEGMYIKQVESNFDLKSIENSGLKLAYDAMYGAGQNVVRRILPTVQLLHCEDNPGFKGQAPEPIHKNLTEFCQLIKDQKNIDSGLVTDGDADRIGFYDGSGNFIDSHHIILLLIHYLVKYKNMKGKVVIAFSTTPRVIKLCKHYGLEVEVVKIGFKYICEIMLQEDVLLGGEESGGIAIKGHIPERDGIWMGLILWEFMAKSGKNINQLIEEVYAITGSFAFERSDLHIKEEIKQKVLENCTSGKYKNFGKYKVSRTEDIDGYKYYFENGDWLMIRASGTEPVLRTYAESSTRDEAFAILKAGELTLLN